MPATGEGEPQLSWFVSLPCACIGDLIGLKIVLHTGACLAVTLNDRLDYFGQTVNIAARIQALAGADEIAVTDYVLSLPGAAELVADLEIERRAVQLKGIAGDVAVHRLRGANLNASRLEKVFELRPGCELRPG